ncbi:hypothetical protein HAX54_048837 [Datura stramonium]|uniref:Uncharacterized protein n=1 Tax=Datura stramonium TaxID=4076 RepID=A0ABS8WJQ4_DATST|nr:hypothetical protein [Datura stramonium]
MLWLSQDSGQHKTIRSANAVPKPNKEPSLSLSRPAYKEHIDVDKSKTNLDIESEHKVRIEKEQVKAESNVTSTQPKNQGKDIWTPMEGVLMTIIMQSNIDAFVDPQGWALWNTIDFGLTPVGTPSIVIEVQSRLTKESLTGEVTKRAFQETLLTSSLPATLLTPKMPRLPKANIPYEAGHDKDGSGQDKTICEALMPSQPTKSLRYPSSRLVHTRSTLMLIRARQPCLLVKANQDHNYRDCGSKEWWRLCHMAHMLTWRGRRFLRLRTSIENTARNRERTSCCTKGECRQSKDYNRK